MKVRVREVSNVSDFGVTVTFEILGDADELLYSHTIGIDNDMSVADAKKKIKRAAKRLVEDAERARLFKEALLSEEIPL